MRAALFTISAIIVVPLSAFADAGVVVPITKKTQPQFADAVQSVIIEIAPGRLEMTDKPVNAAYAAALKILKEGTKQ